MRNQFEKQLQQLNEDLISMGALCKEAVADAMTALLYSDKQARQKAFLTEYEIDHKERDIESLCMKLLLQQQPVARDLRNISAALKMISDMERIGDQASDIADITKYLENSELTQHVHIHQMAEAAMGMLTDSIEAFVKKDLLLARKVMKQDDVVDERSSGEIRADHSHCRRTGARGDLHRHGNGGKIILNVSPIMW